MVICDAVWNVNKLYYDQSLSKNNMRWNIVRLNLLICYIKLTGLSSDIKPINILVTSQKPTHLVDVKQYS